MACRGRCLPSHRHNDKQKKTTRGKWPVEHATVMSPFTVTHSTTLSLCSQCSCAGGVGHGGPCEGLWENSPRWESECLPPLRPGGEDCVSAERWRWGQRGREEWNKRKMRLDQSKPPSKSKPPKTPKQIIRKCIWEFYLVPKILICHLLMCLLKYNIATKDQFKARHYKQNYWLNLRYCFHNVVIFLFYYYP